MITSFTMRKQTLETNGNWLYKDQLGERIFSQCVYLPEGDEPWAECTNEEKEQWKREHQQPEPEPQEGENE